MIKTECHSDDRCVEVNFDATPWFEDATDEQILNLVKCGWGGDYPTDDVALYMADQHDGVKSMFDYIALRSRIETLGFECHVNSDDGVRWIKKNRKSLLTLISQLVE